MSLSCHRAVAFTVSAAQDLSGGEEVKLGSWERRGGLMALTWICGSL